MKKVAIIGPESTGKSWLAEKLAVHFHTHWVPEFARQYIEGLDRPYQRNDLLEIAKGQIDLEDTLEQEANGILFCDTNLYVIKIWSEHKYGQCDPWILHQIRQRKYDLHLLTYIDIPWEDDPQREHPHLRNYFYDVYHSELVKGGVKFEEVKGLNETRLESAIMSVKRIINIQ